MNTSLYQQVEQYVVDVFTQAGDVGGIKHFLRTADWVRVLKPDADEALLIAAVAHDIERGFRDRAKYDQIFKQSAEGFSSDEHLTHHQNEGARIIGEYLEKIGAPTEMITRVRLMVARHEIGGDNEQNLIKDADSVSFFENNVEFFVTKKIADVGKEKVKDKLDWMYNRITSAQAKEIVRPWYEAAIKKLE